MRKTARETVLERLEELKMSRYALAKSLKGIVSPSSIYDYLRDGTSLTARDLEHVLSTLQLEVRAEKHKK